MLGSHQQFSAMSNLKSLIAYVPQQTQILNKSISYNLFLDSKNELSCDKSFLDKEDMNNIDFSKKITQKKYSDNDFVYNFLSSIRKKINDPLGKKSITTD